MAGVNLAEIHMPEAGRLTSPAIKRAALFVCSRANDAADAALLMEALGLSTRRDA